MKPGKFIVLEGINGCGKGTQINRLHSYISSLGKAVPIFTSGEPNDFDENGRKAREMLKSDGDPYSNNSQAMEYFARNRGTHNEIFVPMLEKGINVVSDRYWHSNYVFQGLQGISFKDIVEVNRDYRVPDLTVILDVPVEVALKRLGSRDGKNVRRKFDRDLTFMDKARKVYKWIPTILLGLTDERNIRVINGHQSPEEVWREVRGAYESTFKS